LLEDRFFRTDIDFGSGNELNGAFLVGPGLGERLKKMRFKGLDLEPIKDARR